MKQIARHAVAALTMMIVFQGSVSTAETPVSYEPLDIKIGDNPVSIGKQPHFTHIYKFWRENMNAHSYFLYLAIVGKLAETPGRNYSANIVTFESDHDTLDGIGENPDAEPCPSLVRFFKSNIDGTKALFVARSLYDLTDNGPATTQTVTLYHLVENESPGGSAYEFVAFAHFAASQALCNVEQLDTEIKNKRDLWTK